MRLLPAGSAGSLPATLSGPTRTRYLIATGLFVTLFVGSVTLGWLDIAASYKEYTHLGFPKWSFHFLQFAKVAGLIAILSNRSRTLKDFAYAGFLFDLLLALGAHIDKREVKVVLPIVGLAIWGCAFFMNRKVYP
jgi:DoxX-like family